MLLCVYNLIFYSGFSIIAVIFCYFWLSPAVILILFVGMLGSEKSEQTDVHIIFIEFMYLKKF